MEMDWDAIQKGIIGVLTFTTGYLAFVSKNKDRSYEQIKVVIDEYKSLVDRHKKELEEVKVEHRTDLDKVLTRLRDLEASSADKEKKINDLMLDLLLFESSVKYIPVPYWSKSDGGVMLYVNEAYCVLFLEPIGKSKKDYEGNKDYDIWSKEVANMFREHDLKVMRTKRRQRFIEVINSPNGKVYLEVVKFPRFLDNRDSKVIGVSGIVLRTSSTPIIIDDLDILDIL